jgi:low affinity Fe/Cu permease
MNTHSKVEAAFEGLSQRATVWAGSSPGFAGAAVVALAWTAAGPGFSFSSEWQMVIQTVTSVITFLMVFLIQRSQNKESRAIQLKLNELIASQAGASNRLVSAEELSEEELQHLHDRYLQLAASLEQRSAVRKPSSVEEAADAAPERDQPKSRRSELQRQGE